MTVIAYPHASRSVPCETRLRLTARGRRIIVALAALPAVTAVIFALIGGSSALASGEAAAPSGSFETVTVLSGDSLWSIAQDIAPDADPRDVVAALEQLNAVDGSTLSAGRQLSVPTQYSSGR